VDAVDEYLESIDKKDDRYYYKYGTQERPVIVKEIVVPFRTDQGMGEKKFTAYFTSHGPVIREKDGKWVTIQLMQKPVEQLTQSFVRTKTRSYKAYRETMELKANSSNNTIFADSDGNIAYFHGNFIPRRDTRFDFNKPVDGSDPATDWKGLLSVDETPHLFNPKSGWLYNSNNAPWSAAGPSSPKREDYPVYVEMGGESARGLHAIRVLKDKKDFTIDSLIGAAYDSYMPWFETTIPALVKAWDGATGSNPLKAKLADQIAVLRKWDFRWADDSVPTSLAIFWGSDLDNKHRGEWSRGSVSSLQYVATKLPPEQLLQSLAAASDKLTADFGTWKTPWGEINRFQRVNDDIAPHFSDSAPSIPVEFASSEWGSLASFGARAYPDTKKWYGTSGNSFVAVVEFGDKVHAKAVTAGGESGDPSSKHFDDEAKRYSNGKLRDVYFYRDQLKGHTEREYHPGQ
jgi:acyl-homoserine lactone acylase PvdQ